MFHGLGETSGRMRAWSLMNNVRYQTERPTLVTLMSVFFLLGGGFLTVFGLMGIFVTSRGSDSSGAIVFGATLIPVGLFVLATGYGLITRHRWSRISAVVLLVVIALSSVDGTIINIESRHFFNLGLNILLVVTAVWVCNFLCRPSIKLYFSANGAVQSDLDAPS